MLGVIMEERDYALSMMQTLASMYQQVLGEWHCYWNFNDNHGWMSKNSWI